MPTKPQSNLNTDRTSEEDVLADLVREGAHSREMGLRDLILEIAKSFLQAALQGELTAHLKGEKEAEGVRANKRNGTSKKRVKTYIGVVEIDLPRDRNGTFKPILIPKHARTFGGLDSCRLVAMYALGTSSRDISAFIKELYGIRASQEYIGTVTESVLQDIESWRRTRSTGCTRRSSSTPFTSTSETA